MEKRGLAVFEGVVYGKALIYEQYQPEESAFSVSDGDLSVEERLNTISRAVEAARCELAAIRDKVAGHSPQKAEIFSAHQLLLEDVAIRDEIYEQILNGMTVFRAVVTVFDTFSEILARAENAFTNERTADLKDVRNRILRCLEHKPDKNLSSLPEPCVVIARELLPSDTAVIDRKNVLAIVTEHGGATSHTAIIARSYGIPTVLGIEKVLSCVADNDGVIVDGKTGTVIFRPEKAQIDNYLMKRAAYEHNRKTTRIYRNIPAVTLDGHPIEIKLNISGINEINGDDIEASDGVGLFRSEFLYMKSASVPPDEETQFLEYSAVAAAFNGKPVVLRTLDIGGDKQFPFVRLPKEDNPFLGKRALRLCLEEKELFRTQLRAALRASMYGNLWIMFPMVGTLEDFRAAKAFTELTMAELDHDGFSFNRRIPLGVMIEVPSIALIADKIATEVDFASIGTNDLCQYLMAVDRLNTSVASYYQSFHPSVLRLIGYVADCFSSHGKSLSVCGEMGGDENAVIALIGLGIRTLSINSVDIASIKRIISGVSIAKAKMTAEMACACESSDTVKHILSETVASIIQGHHYAAG